MKSQELDLELGPQQTPSAASVKAEMKSLKMLNSEGMLTPNHTIHADFSPPIPKMQNESSLSKLRITALTSSPLTKPTLSADKQWVLSQLYKMRKLLEVAHHNCM